ncbi:GDP-mannose 4,6-dehydratase [Selenomonas sputigena]|jgi:GDP-mannose 4,6-dehydratase|uniref:GDP-mannose 4,6-dehydratase n=2 Tax=Selenomonas sputigena (strain ATCC 35185 / DSM 20758 / CCUG 44933 / VPI D19B-28) TaxID=546271 RepID=F4EWQ1_SELS3|nr:GDP-mannose 4,6-dehydratase [Selenomonas sputigena]AEB99027.1 GDP-mannose 4,6-dehydratase [Selenomonas sputigena ATCC 35185]
MKTALITGINGQDGSYLAEYLLDRGYEVYGVVRRSSIENAEKMRNVLPFLNRIRVVPCALENALSVYKLFVQVRPDECYHLAASSFVSYALEDDLSIMMNNFTTTHNILSSIVETCPSCRMYFAGSSEIFGNVKEAPQSEETAYNPRSVYGISKMAGHSLIKNYRERYNVYACTGFTYNHESPRRGYNFVTRKITSFVAGIILGAENKLELGNLDAVRDWGYAPEYVEAMHKMLQQDMPKDYVIATGALHSVRELLEIAFGKVGLDYQEYIHVNEAFLRPEGAIPLVGNASAIYQDLGWRAKKGIEEIISDMVETDIQILKKRNEKR